MSTIANRQFPVILILVLAVIMTFVFVVPNMGTHVISSSGGGSSSEALVDDTVDYALLEEETIIYVESRHTNLGHAIVNSVAAQTIVEQTIATFNRGQDPNGLARLLCKTVEMINGKTYYSMWMASLENPAVGSVAVYTSDGVWITAFDGKAKDVFEYGTPRGSKSWKMSPCDTFMPPPMALP